MTERFVLGDGAELALVRAGDPGADVTVLLLHSYAADRRVWHKVLELLPGAVEAQVIAYDHRGHGDSSRADVRTATVERLGDDLGEVIAAQRGRVVLVGHGMGGLVAMAAVARHGISGIGGLALLGTLGVDVVLPRTVGRLVQDLHAILGPFITGQVRRKVDKATAVGLRWLLLGDDPDPDDVRLVAEMVLRHWPEAIALFQPGLDRYDRKAALELVGDTPVLAIAGERDRLVPASHASALVSSVRNGYSVTLPGCGHMLPLEGAAQIVPRIAGVVGKALRNG